MQWYEVVTTQLLNVDNYVETINCIVLRWHKKPGSLEIFSFS